ncbi:hypothetical protein DOTSEDRAFT_75250 [Dothistroma septosporum NZE10]|uniref:DUF7730 domain-containing protein n=1 Tax=Dothistroma septosporum (strain NZE10 / CBS 128990) TaxID=675120 RepID=M2WKM1_DOTSN|nr:hypothetical protein DOTSEDRAFT_75250 [Dothistroma septosporum NZE10]
MGHIDRPGTPKMTDNTATQNQATTRSPHLHFAALPDVARNKIYKLLLKHGELRLQYIVVDKGTAFRDRKLKVKAKALVPGQGKYGEKMLPFLGPQRASVSECFVASRQIYNEALPVLYGQNTFRFSAIQAFEKFTKLSKPGLPFLRNIYIHSPGRAWSLFERGMKNLTQANPTGLQSLRIALQAMDAMEFDHPTKSSRLLDGIKYYLRRVPRARRQQN